jgi:hypothetical protein
MFDPQQTLIDAFVPHLLRALRDTFPDADPAIADALDRAARTALQTLCNCDCAYHDLEHTVRVADAGLSILQGRQICRGDLTADDWLHALVALLYHDIGYLRGLLRGDRDGAYIADESGRRVITPAAATDAAMAPWHVARGRLYVEERFAADPVLNSAVLAQHIGMTQFPVPREAPYQETDSLSALVRAADLIGQMADPDYPNKQGRLFTEFQETGDAKRLGVASADALRAMFPAFFYDQVFPYLSSALEYLALTRDGRAWSARLYRHVHGETGSLPNSAKPWPAPASLSTEALGPATLGSATLGPATLSPATAGAAEARL